MMMQAYQMLIQKDEVGYVRRIKRNLGIVRLPGMQKILFFGSVTPDIELIVRQFILARLGGVRLHKAILYSLGSGKKISFPFSQTLRAVLVNEGVSISHWRSVLLLFGHCLALYIKGVKTIFIIIFHNIKRLFNPTSIPKRPFAVFHELSDYNLPRPNKQGNSYDFISWFNQWNGFGKLYGIYHDVSSFKKGINLNGTTVDYKEIRIPIIRNFGNICLFILWSIFAATTAFFSLIIGRWWYALLLGELARAAAIRYSKKEDLADMYLFCNSDAVYRPIWTYEAEAKGSRVISYFYSTFEEFKLPKGYEPNSIYWSLMSWSYYLVWDEYQKALLKESIGEQPKIEVVGPIWYSSAPVDIPEISQQSIAVFDIQPIKNSRHFGFSTMADIGYGDPKIPMKFMQDIIDSLPPDAVIVHKRKRADNRSYKPYTLLIEKFRQNGSLIAIEPQASPNSVIEKCTAVISMPFTSTGIIAKYLDKPSAYYDPSGKLLKDDKGAHGITILSNEQELRSWICNALADKKA